MRVFLTGANGYLGRVLLAHLSRTPEVESITGIGLSTPVVPMPPKARFVRLDIRSPELVQAVAGHDVIIHTAAVVLWPARMPAAERDDINLNGTRQIAQAALANKVRRFVHASSMAVYDPTLARGQSGITEEFPMGKGDSPFYYWNAKALAERTVTELLAGSGITLTCFRPIYIIGPRNRPVIDSYRRNAVKFLGYSPRRQFIHEDDVAAAFLMATLRDLPGAFNVVPDDFMPLYDVWKVLGKKFVPTVPLPMAKLVTALKWRYFDSPIHHSWVEDMLVDLVATNARLKQHGWAPRYNSLQALQTAL